MVLLHCDTNVILAEPTKNRSQEHMVQAFTRLHARIKRYGHKITSHVLDNEAPPLLIEYLHHEKIQYQKVPSYVHRANSEHPPP